MCAGAFLYRDGLVLLGLRSQTRSSYPGVWDAIGGHAKPTEAPREALVRELEEEIQITPIAFRDLATLVEPRRRLRPHEPTSIRHWLAAVADDRCLNLVKDHPAEISALLTRLTEAGFEAAGGFWRWLNFAICSHHRRDYCTLTTLITGVIM